MQFWWNLAAVDCLPPSLQQVAPHLAPAALFCNDTSSPSSAAAVPAPFVHVLYDHYTSPDYLDFGYRCKYLADAPADGPEVRAAANKLVAHFRAMAAVYPDTVTAQQDKSATTVSHAETVGQLGTDNTVDADEAQTLANSQPLLFLWGDDFRFSFDQERVWQSVDRVLTYLRAREKEYGVRVQFSTPTRFFTGLM